MREDTEVLKYLRSINNIHNGGCLVSAYAYYLWLKNNNLLTQNFQIAVLENFDDEGFGNKHWISANHAFINGKRKNATASHHFGWTFDNGKKVLDASLENQHYDYQLLVPHEATEKFCLSALNYGSWNWAFERKFWIPEISAKLGINLSNIFLNKGKDTSYGYGRGGHFRKRPKLTDFQVTSLKLEI